MLKSAVMTQAESVTEHPPELTQRVSRSLDELDLLASLHYLRDFDQERIAELAEALLHQSFSPGDIIVLQEIGRAHV